MTSVNGQNLFSCPICYETPTSEIFQCANGHPVCSLCITELVQCPQCRVKYGTNKIRNRALEDIMDGIQFDCPNKSFGCGDTMHRRDLNTHAKTCSFRAIDVSLCHCMGYRCSYSTNSRKIPEAVQHFWEVHEAVDMKSSRGKLILVDFPESQFHCSSTWTPHIFQHETSRFLVFVRINGIPQTVSLICIYLGNPIKAAKGVSVKFTVCTDNKPNLEWTMNPVSLLEAEDFIIAPLLQIPGNVLKNNFLTEGSLQLMVRLLSSNMEDGDTIHLQECLEISPAHNQLSVDLGLSERVRSAHLATYRDTTNISVKVICDGCEVKTPCRTFYHCLQCKDYNLCDTCWKRKEHAHHFFTAIRNDMELVALEKLKWDRVAKDRRSILTKDVIVEGALDCTECKYFEISMNARYACMTCPTLYALCTNCYTSKKRNACENHKFLALKNST